MSFLAWLAVITGTYIVYPWYRATPPPGTTDLSAFPQKFLIAHATTVGWHALGMEWKEHVAWLVPIAITMATAVVAHYGKYLGQHRRLKYAVLAFVGVSMIAAGVAGFWGAMINKYAPTSGGPNITVLRGEMK